MVQPSSLRKTTGKTGENERGLRTFPLAFASLVNGLGLVSLSLSLSLPPSLASAARRRRRGQRWKITEKKQKRRKKREGVGEEGEAVGRVVKNGGEERVFRGRARLGGVGGPSLIFARCISRALSGEREDRCECDLLLSRPVKLNYYDRYR